MMRFLPLACAAAGAFTAASLAQTYDLADAGPGVRPTLKPLLPFRFDASAMVANRLEVKLREGVRGRLIAGQIVDLGGQDLADLHRLLAGCSVQRLFTRAPDDLDRERTALNAHLPAATPPLVDLNNWFAVRTSGAQQTEALVNALNRLDAVETAYPEHRVARLDDIPPTTPQFAARQTYFGAAPAGYEYNAIWSMVGARFQTGQMAQLEGDWYMGHEDQSDLVAANIIGVAPTNFASWRSHGTACVGLMGAQRNGYGVRGFGSGCRRFFVSSLENGAANMISLVTARLSAGDMMSSSFAWVVGNGDHAPVDFPQAEFDAVRVATAAGIFYAFGAGNSADDLGTTALYGNRYTTGAVSSGGFIIGATGAGDLARIGFSNYGQRIDANGWGTGVTTMGGGGDLFFPNSDVRQTYTAGFGGTSAAGPAVAGCIASYTGAVKEQNGVRLTPAQVVADLQATGTAIPSGQIGNRPHLVQLLARYGLPDGLLTTQMGALGGNARVQVSGNAGEPFALLLSGARASVASPWNRRILIDLATAVQLTIGAIGGGGSTTLTLPVPNSSVLRNVTLYLQSPVVRAGAIHLTNSVELWIE